MPRTSRIARIAAISTVALGATASSAMAAPLVVNASVASNAVVTGQQTTVTASAFGGNGPVIQWAWDLDGNGSYEVSSGAYAPKATNLSGLGLKTIRVRAVTLWGSVDSDTANVLLHQRPTANFTFAPVQAVASETVTFNAGGSSDDHGIAEYHWDLNGNGVTDAITATPVRNHVFTTGGLKTVGLRVKDIHGAFSLTRIKQVNVIDRDAPIPANGGGGAPQPEPSPEPSPSPEPTPPADTTAPVPTITGSPAQFDDGLAQFQIGCPVGESRCTGELKLARKGKAKFSKESFDVVGGQTMMVEVLLNKKARKIVKRKGSLSTNATAAATDAAGNQGQGTAKVTIEL